MDNNQVNGPRLTRRGLIGSGIALGSYLALGAPGVGARAPPARMRPGTTGGGSLSMFGWDIADTSAGLGLGFEANRLAWQEATGNTLTFDGVPFGDFVATGTTRARAGELSDVVELLPNLNHAGIFPALAPDGQGRLRLAGRRGDRLGVGRDRPRQPRRVRRHPRRRPGHALLLQQGALRGRRARPRRAADHVGRVRGGV